jgi:ADP-sugar diphosphatase
MNIWVRDGCDNSSVMGGIGCGLYGCIELVSLRSMQVYKIHKYTVDMMSLHRKRIDEELHTCMSQLESLHTGMNLSENMGFTMLGAEYENTKVDDCVYRVSVLGQTITVRPDTSMAPIADSKFRMIFEMKAFVDWLNGFERTFFKYCSFSTIFIQNIDFWAGRVGFLKFKTDLAYKKDGTNLSSIVFMRGPAVAILMILECDGKYYALTTLQPRAPIGKYAYCEIPAGMIDDSSDFLGVAAKEIKEETSIQVNTKDLIDMLQVNGYSGNGLYPSVGGCDEFLKFYLFTAQVSRSGLNQLNVKLTGAIKEGEKIRLKIVPLDRLLHESPDMKTFTALYLYSMLSSDTIRDKRVDMIGHDFSKK